MKKKIVNFLIDTMQYPLWLQLVIIVPIFFTLSFGLFNLLRLLGICIYKSKDDYYESDHDPLTMKKVLGRSLLVTFCLLGIYFTPYFSG